MSQEFPENTADFFNEEPVEEVVEQVEPKEEEPKAPEPAVAPMNQALISELQIERQTRHRLEEELHGLRNATLQQAAAPPDYDPIEASLARLKKGADPDAYRFVEPMLRPILEETYNQRKTIEALAARNQQLESGLTYIAQKDREREAHTQLAQAIPDLPQIGPKILEYVSKQSAEIQKMYADNPALLLPLADVIRGAGGGKPGKNVQGVRNTLSLDTGAAGDRAAQLTASDIQSMKPGSEAFAKVQSNFWGSE